MSQSFWEAGCARPTARLVEPHCSVVLWVEPYSNASGTIVLRNVPWTVPKCTHIRHWPSALVRGLSSAQQDVGAHGSWSTMWVCGFEQKEHTYTRLCHSVCNISVYMYVIEWMHVITTWNCHQLSTQTLRGCCAGFSRRSDTEHVNVNLCKGIPAAPSSCGSMTLDFHLYISWFLGIYTIWIPCDRETNHMCMKSSST